MKERGKINRSDLVNEYAARYGVSKREAKQIISEIFPLIIDLVCSGYRIHLNGFGDFHTITRKMRGSVNPKTHEKIVIGEKIIPKFSPGRYFRREVAKSAELSKQRQESEG